MCSAAGFNHFFTVAPDDYDVMRVKERFGRTYTFLDPDPIHTAETPRKIRAGLAGKRPASSRQPFSGGARA
jgi:hypothetical protein